MYDPISGNAAYAKYSPVTLPPIGQRAGFAEVSVKLNPHTSQPELITYLNGSVWSACGRPLDALKFFIEQLT